MPRQVLRVLSDHLAALGTRLGWPGKVTRLRWIVARHVPARLALGGVLAVGSLLAVRAEQRDAVAERDRWGAAVAVLVARVEIVAGTPLSTELVELRRLPAAGHAARRLVRRVLAPASFPGKAVVRGDGHAVCP